MTYVDRRLNRIAERIDTAARKGDTINRARIVRDRPYWAVIDQQTVHARFLHRAQAKRYRNTLNAKPATED